MKYAEDNTAYKIHTEELKWEDARERCISEGAHLVIATNPEKIKHITNSGEFPPEDWVYTGIYRPTTSSDWVSVDNGEFHSLPRSLRGNTNSNEDVIRLIINRPIRPASSINPMDKLLDWRRRRLRCFMGLRGRGNHQYPLRSLFAICL